MLYILKWYLLASFLYFKNSEFKGICTDNYGNIFVVDSNMENVIMLSEDGILQRTLLSGFDINSTSHLAIDGCGNLWVCDDDNDITIYSYL